MVSKEDNETQFPRELASKLISVTEASQVVVNGESLTPSYIRRLLRNGRLVGHKVGNSWLTTEEAIREYLKTERHPGPKPYT